MILSIKCLATPSQFHSPELRIVITAPKNKNKGRKRSGPKGDPTNPSSALVIYKGPTQLSNPSSNADADMVSRTIVDLILMPLPNGVQTNTLTVNSYPLSTNGDWIKFVALYNEYRILSQTIDYIPFCSVCDNISPTAAPLSAQFPGIIVGKVGRGDTAPTLASTTDVDTACKIEPICFTGCRRLAKIQMSSVGEASMFDTDTPAPMWITTVTAFYAVTMPNYSGLNGCGWIKSTTLCQFRGAS
jgi:hypothetical protein